MADEFQQRQQEFFPPISEIHLPSTPVGRMRGKWQKPTPPSRTPMDVPLAAVVRSAGTGLGVAPLPRPLGGCLLTSLQTSEEAGMRERTPGCRFRPAPLSVGGGFCLKRDRLARARSRQSPRVLGRCSCVGPVAQHGECSEYTITWSPSTGCMSRPWTVCPRSIQSLASLHQTLLDVDSGTSITGRTRSANYSTYFDRHQDQRNKHMASMARIAHLHRRFLKKPRDHPCVQLQLPCDNGILVSCHPISLHPRQDRYPECKAVLEEEQVGEDEVFCDDPSTVCHTNTPTKLSPRSLLSTPAPNTTEAESTPEQTAENVALSQNENNSKDQRGEQKAEESMSKGMEKLNGKVSEGMKNMPLPIISFPCIEMENAGAIMIFDTEAAGAVGAVADRIIRSALGDCAPDVSTRQLWQNVHRELLRQSTRLIKQRNAFVPLERVGTYPKWLSRSAKQIAVQKPACFAGALQQPDFGAIQDENNSDQKKQWHLYSKSAQLPRVPALLQTQPYFRPASRLSQVC